MAKVSIIIPNYNHARYLSARIKSVINQTYQDFEVIILDDCSTDDSKSVIEEYAQSDSRIKVFYNETNSGSTFKQWNKGIALSSGKYIWIAESDDFSELTFLEKSIQILESNVQVALVYSNSNIINSNDQLIASYLDWVEPIDSKKWKSNYINSGKDEIIQYLMYRNLIPNVSACLLRRDSYIDVGSANESLKLCGDWLLYIQLLLKYDIGYIAEPLNYYRVHDNTVRNKYFYSINGFDEIWKIFSSSLNRLNIKKEVINKKRFRFILDVWLQSLSKSGIISKASRAHFKYLPLMFQFDKSIVKLIFLMYFRKFIHLFKIGNQ